MTFLKYNSNKDVFGSTFKSSGFRVPLGDMTGHELMRRFVKGNGPTVNIQRTRSWLAHLRSQVEQGRALILGKRILEHAKDPSKMMVKGVF